MSALKRNVFGRRKQVLAILIAGSFLLPGNTGDDSIPRSKNSVFVDAYIGDLTDQGRQRLSGYMNIVQTDGANVLVCKPGNSSVCYSVTRDGIFKERPVGDPTRTTLKLKGNQDSNGKEEAQACIRDLRHAPSPNAVAHLKAQSQPEEIQPLPTEPSSEPKTEDIQISSVPQIDPAMAPMAMLPSNAQDLKTLDIGKQLANEVRETEIVKNAVLQQEANYRAATFDQQTVSEDYFKMPAPVLKEHFERARNELNEVVNHFSAATNVSNLSPAERARFQRTAMNARDRAEIGAALLEQKEETINRIPSQYSPLQTILSQKINPLAKTPDLSEVFGSKPAAPTSNDALVNRLVMFTGLPPEKKSQVAKKLKLFETPEFTLPSGEKKTIPILHNGYVFGGTATGTDCSAFASAALPADVRKTRFTTLDFRTMWQYRVSGKFPKPPTYPKKRQTELQTAAESFIPIDLHMGDELRTGDFLVYRPPWDTSGHVFIVRKYNAKTKQVDVIEASQSAGTIRERSFPLSLDPLEYQKRRIRPGLFALRLKPGDNAGCKYKDQAKATSHSGGGS